MPRTARTESPDEVHEYGKRFRAAGFEIVDEWDEPDYASVKVRDPDGYVVEVSCEPERA